ncbi:MAG: hypothetical protein QM564_09255 [Bergeyella sp.]
MTEINKTLKSVYAGLKQMENDLKIENWKSFELDFSTDFQNKSQIIQKIKNQTGKNVGFYAIFKDEDCLYIGIGRPIWSRLKSHYYASQEKDKAKRWSDFFQKHKTNLKIYWKEFSCVDNPKIDDKTRLLIEAILTNEYEPEFEK